MQIAILLYDRFTALDAVGPYQVLVQPARRRDRLRWPSEPGSVTDDAGALTLVAEAALADVPHPDIVVVPGGPGRPHQMDDEPAPRLAARGRPDEHVDDVGLHRLAHPGRRRACSTAAGPPRTGWRWTSSAGSAPSPSASGCVFDGKYVTAAGVSSGIDMALALAGRIAGDEAAQAIQLGIEYDPQPPYDAGSPAHAPAEIVSRLEARSRFILTGS